mmetsp:Transcript_3048/g.8682  ORF Transcript_3048/g.8682 Transcript_3048/m.8682 type:complete len:127 (-) Transcript_3048:376-756(-)
MMGAGFIPTPSLLSGVLWMIRSLVVLLLCAASSALSVGCRASVAACRSPAPAMMGNMAPDGPFTPVVLAGKVVLGEKLLNKVRGKLITYHAQAITEFCETYGVAREMRGALVKKAKIVGGDLGFLS